MEKGYCFWPVTKAINWTVLKKCNIVKQQLNSKVLKYRFEISDKSFAYTVLPNAVSKSNFLLFF